MFRKPHYKVSLVLIMILAAVIILPLSASGTDLPDGHIVNYPAEISDVLYNPYTGWAPWASNTSHPQPHKLVFTYLTWKEIEPVRGSFNFDAFERENNFSHWGSKGVKIILLFNMDYPGAIGHKDIPDWLYTMIKGDGTFYKTTDGTQGGFSPNYKNPTLISEHRRLLSKLAERYNNDSRVFMVCMGSVGHWGEMHTTYIKDRSAAGCLPDVTYTSQYEQAYADLFTNKFVSSRYPRQVAKDNGIGLHNHMFGHPTHTYNWFINWFLYGYTNYSTGDVHPAMPDFWKYAPSGGELAEYPGTKWFSNSYFADTLNQAKESHLSWLGPCCMASQPVGGTYQANMNKFLKTIGYRYVLRSISHPAAAAPGSTVKLTMNWDNIGAAPFYFDWPLELSIADASGKIVYSTICNTDIRNWLPGTRSEKQDFTLPSNLADGKYGINVAILDPETDEPAIDLAIKGKRTDGRYTVSWINVSVNAPEIFESGSEPETSDESASINIFGASMLRMYPNPSVSKYSAVLKDSSGRDDTSGEAVTWTLMTPVKGISVDSTGLVTIRPEVRNSFILKASWISNPNVFTTYQVTVVLPDGSNLPQPAVLPVTPTPTPVPTQKPSPSPTVTPTRTPSPSPSPSPTVTPTRTPSPSPSPTVTPTRIPTPVPSLTPSPPPAASPTMIQETPSPSPSKSVSSLTIYGTPSIKVYSTPSNTQYTVIVRNGNGSELPAEKVNWSISPAVTGISVTSGGLVTVGPEATAPSFVLKAVSVSNIAVYDTLAVTLTSHLTVSNVLIFGSDELDIYSYTSTSQYTASVRDQYNTVMDDEDVTWSIAYPVTGVSVNSSGLVSIGPEAKASSFLLKVASMSKPTVYATKTIILTSHITVSSIEISGDASLEIYESASYSQYSVTIKDQYNTSMPSENVTWKLASPVSGVSISSSGLVTIQSSAKPGSFTIKTVSITNPQVYGTYTVTLTYN